jgi:hypothetical protein
VTPTGTPPLALAPGRNNPGPGANAGRLYDAPPARRLDATGSAFDRACDGWTVYTLTTIRPATGTEPGIYDAQVYPASSVRTDAYQAWLGHVWPAAACTHPVLLRGTVTRLDTATGEILNRVDTDDLPDGAIYKPCGNRRASVCPGCAETYRRDAFHLIRSGLVGGKGITTEVSAHPAVFATFTAPSFGTVHTRTVRRHACAYRDNCTCKPEPCHARRDTGTCPHGRPAACFRRHGKHDPGLGHPLCPDCYDYRAAAVWNNCAGELWRRTKQDIERYLNALARKRGLPPVRVCHGKVVEYQARGAAHFHAVIRLDGNDPDDPARIVPPPGGITTDDLDDAIRYAVGRIAFRTLSHPLEWDGWLIGWGEQVDVRPISLRQTGELTDLAVAGYLAKYSTKGTEDSGHTSVRITPDNIDLYAEADGTHTERLVHACWEVGKASGPMYGKRHGWDSLRRWAHMLGFGGHFLTKARRYSVTFTQLRQARVNHQRQHDTEDASSEAGQPGGTSEETLIVLASLSYAGNGWRSLGDAMLANTAANQARKRRQTAREATVRIFPEMPKAA